MKNAVSLRPTYWASVSGGKYSAEYIDNIVKTKYARKIDEIRKSYEIEKKVRGCLNETYFEPKNRVS